MESFEVWNIPIRNNLKICDRRCDKWWMEREPLLNLIRICCQQVRKYFTVFCQYKILKRGSWSCRVWICVEKRVTVLISFVIKAIWLRLNLNYKLAKIWPGIGYVLLENFFNVSWSETFLFQARILESRWHLTPPLPPPEFFTRASSPDNLASLEQKG